ncbi:MAG TPA: hypothetical protein VF546_11130 [Pyrinomonadaceae bacterium]|jgi:hypothetical protein
MAQGLLSRATHALRYFLLRRLPTCKQMAVVMSESMERPLTLRERVMLRLHLWVCIWCVWYLEQLQLLRATAHAAGARATSDVHLSLEARERLKRALKNQS